jgi:hypothetical protein
MLKKGREVEKYYVDIFLYLEEKLKTIQLNSDCVVYSLFSTFVRSGIGPSFQRK